MKVHFAEITVEAQGKSCSDPDKMCTASLCPTKPSMALKFTHCHLYPHTGHCDSILEIPNVKMLFPGKTFSHRQHTQPF